MKLKNKIFPPAWLPYGRGGGGGGGGLAPQGTIMFPPCIEITQSAAISTSFYFILIHFLIYF